MTGSAKGKGHRITGLFGPSFGFRPVRDVIFDIQTGTHTYYVREGSFESVVRVVGQSGERRIVTTLDLLSWNNLENVCDCWGPSTQPTCAG